MLERAETPRNCKHDFHRITGKCKLCDLHASEHGTIGCPSGPQGAQGEPGKGLSIWEEFEALQKQYAELLRRIERLERRR